MALDIGDYAFFTQRTYKKIPNKKYQEDDWSSALQKEFLSKPQAEKPRDVGVYAFLTGELFTEPKFRYVIERDKSVKPVQVISFLEKDNQNNHKNNQ